jgi:hypothetical protein
MLQPRETTRMADAQHVIDTVPSQFPPDAARMQRIVDIDVAFDE